MKPWRVRFRRGLLWSNEMERVCLAGASCRMRGHGSRDRVGPGEGDGGAGTGRRTVMTSIPFVGSGLTADGLARFDRSAPGERPIMACRWHIDAEETLRFFWPAPGGERACVAMGWVAADSGTGVIEACPGGVTDGMLRMLQAAFPGRRWFEGAWDGSETVAGPARLAA